MAYYGTLPSGSVLQQASKSSLTLASSSSTSYIELHNDYRVAITPRLANSRIHVTFNFSVNSNGPDVGTIVHFRVFRLIGSTYSYPTSDGGTFNGNIGNRSSTSAALRYAASDLNDVGFITLSAYDDPGTTSQVQYGFYWKRETGGTSTNYFNHSAGNTTSFGWMTPMVITATEIAA
jgi:hypothetical protein